MIPELERAEASAYASLMSAAGLPVTRVAGAACFATPGVPDMEINRVAGLGVERDPSDDEIEAIEAFFREHASRCAFSVAPGALHDRLLERGYTPGGAWMKFSRDDSPAPTPATDLTVVATTDADAVDAALGEAFGVPAEAKLFGGVAGKPGWTVFLAMAGDEVAGGAGLFLEDGVGWLGVSGTRPAFRGRGAQNALLAARIEHGRELGARAFTVETGAAVDGIPGGSYRNILRAGFAEAYVRPNLLAPE